MGEVQGKGDTARWEEYRARGALPNGMITGKGGSQPDWGSTGQGGPGQIRGVQGKGEPAR